MAHYASATPVSRIAQAAQQFSLPFAASPGPDTWLLGQVYGNTVGAFRRRNSDYRAGQGIHFGLDFSAPCGTPVVAIADAVVAEIDGPHGSPPHNVVLNHAGNLASLYGHLLKRSALRVGSRIKRGELLGFSGDSRFSCHDAPHLHLEIRDQSHQRFFNPIPYIRADWDSLMLTNVFVRNFQRDLKNPRRWQTITEQPNAIRGGRLLNNYALSWPPDNRMAFAYPVRLQIQQAGFKSTETIVAGQMQRISAGACCANPIWNNNSDAVYFLDGGLGRLMGIYRLGVFAAQNPVRVFAAPFQFSPRQQYGVLAGQQLQLERLQDGSRAALPGQNQSAVVFSENESWLAWLVADQTAGFERAPTQVFSAKVMKTASLVLGTVRLHSKFYGANLVGWLNEHTLLLIAKRQPAQIERELLQLDTNTRALHVLAQSLNFRNVSIGPGGRFVFFQRLFAKTKNGSWLLDTQTGQQTQLPFGSYRWRDESHLLFIPFNPGTGQHQILELDAETTLSRNLLTLPSKILDDTWQVAPNGKRILFLNATDHNMYVLELPNR